jgi:hypothetical protein
MHYLPPASARSAKNLLTAATSHTVTCVPNLNGLGKLPFLTQRQMVAGLTGNLPARPFTVASSFIRMVFIVYFSGNSAP